jgi:hypothetical protein
LITSRFGPIRTAFHRLRSVAYIENPSWCSATRHDELGTCPAEEAGPLSRVER